jgi:glycosyltransferase involved in cell wall biosynthesis
MTDGKPLVSIGVPVYNEESYIHQTLDSLLAQDYENFELIISDNASTDATQQICLEYATREPRIKYHRNETNLGSVKNFNTLFKLSSGTYFMWAGAHDRWEPNFISRCIEVLENEPSVVLCYTQAAWIGADGRLLEPILQHVDTRGLNKVARAHNIIWALSNNYMFMGLIRSSALKHTQLLPEIIGPEIVLLSQLSLYGTFAYIPDLLFYLRRTEGHGRLDIQAEKLKRRVPKRWPVQIFYWEMVYHHLRVVRSLRFEGDSYIEKAMTILSIFLGILLKYRWIKKFPSLNRQNRGKTSLR